MDNTEQLEFEAAAEYMLGPEVWYVSWAGHDGQHHDTPCRDGEEQAQELAAALRTNGYAVKVWPL